VSTTSITLVREHSEKVKPPRALFVPFPFGFALGRPNDPDLQHRVLRAALDLMSEPAGPVLRDYPYDETIDEPMLPVQASAVTPPAGRPTDAAMETTQMRRYYEQWLSSAGRTAVGVSGVSPVRFRGVIRLMESYVAGEEADLRERPAEVPLPLFIGYCADDLKAMYFEARLAMQPDATGAEIARWFWGETAVGDLLQRVKERMSASGDKQLQPIAYHIAR